MCYNNDYYSVEMPSQFSKILKHNYGGKSLKTSFAICADLECLLINPNQSYTEKKAIHEPYSYA